MRYDGPREVAVADRFREMKLQWKVDLVADPSLTFDGRRLVVSLLVFMDKEDRELRMAEYMAFHGLKKESDIPDIEFNRFGYCKAHFEFDRFDDFSCSGRGERSAKRAVDRLDLGVYERMDAQGERAGYVFVGHDLVLSVAAKGHSVRLERL